MFGLPKRADQEIKAQKQQETNREKIATIKPHKNHHIFKVDKKTLEISQVEVDRLPARFEKVGKQAKKSEVTIEEGFLYFSAMNKKSVEKKLVKLFFQKDSQKN